MSLQWDNKHDMLYHFLLIFLHICPYFFLTFYSTAQGQGWVLQLEKLYKMISSRNRRAVPLPTLLFWTVPWSSCLAHVHDMYGMYIYTHQRSIRTACSFVIYCVQVAFTFHSLKCCWDLGFQSNVSLEVNEEISDGKWKWIFELSNVYIC